MGTTEANIIVNHHFELYRILASISSSDKGIDYAITPENSFPNFIFNEAENVDIGLIKKKIEANQLPPFWITSSKQFATWLNQNGFKLVRAWPLLIMNKNELIEPKEVEGFVLEKVANKKELLTWKKIVEAEYNYQFKIETLSLWLSISEIDFFIGKVGETIVSATLNFNFNNIVGSHLTATKKEHRKKGIGMQTVYSALNYRFNNGNHSSIASTTELGINAWQKIGYTVLDDKLYINWLLGKMI